VSDLLEKLRAQRVLPILRSTEQDRLVQVAVTVVACGLGVIELTMTSPDAVGDIRRVREQQPDAVIGVGNVTAPRQVASLCDAGADFFVTPVASLAVVDTCVARCVPVVVGAFTPTRRCPHAMPARSRSRSFPPADSAPDTCRT
jgi:2-dehydro-3-deoxyphosphogluconate aldolase / (4S)-4-hydroxy-2-oxoglutarate aldolase